MSQTTAPAETSTAPATTESPSSSARRPLTPEDLYALAEDVLLHRMRLNYEALADGKTGAGVLREILGEVGGVTPLPLADGKGVKDNGLKDNRQARSAARARVS